VCVRERERQREREREKDIIQLFYAVSYVLKVCMKLTLCLLQRKHLTNCN